jgi:hypothetical protein
MMTIPKAIESGKLSIIGLDGCDITVTAQYNPKELQLDRVAAWAKHANVGKEKAQQLEFSGQDGRSLSFELFFDCSEEKSPGGGNNSSLAVGLRNLEKLATVLNDTLKRPPQVYVTWGRFLVEGGSGTSGFKGVIESVSVKYTMFAPNGRPWRATANVKLKEAEKVSLAETKPPTANGSTPSNPQ